MCVNRISSTPQSFLLISFFFFSHFAAMLTHKGAAGHRAREKAANESGSVTLQTKTGICSLFVALVHALTPFPLGPLVWCTAGCVVGVAISIMSFPPKSTHSPKPDSCLPVHQNETTSEGQTTCIPPFCRLLLPADLSRQEDNDTKPIDAPTYLMRGFHTHPFCSVDTPIEEVIRVFFELFPGLLPPPQHFL